MIQMKRMIFILIFTLALNIIIPKPARAMNLVGESAILVDVTTGEILFEKNMDKPMYPASVTKIMTVILALEKGNLDDIVTVSKNAATQDGTRIYLVEGEKVRLKDLVYGALLNSGNDAAVAIAEHFGGSVESFVEMMNEKAKVLGMKNTHFANPSGLPNPNHVTSAYDMSLLAMYALKNPVFREIASSKTYDAKWIGNNVHAFIQNHNRLLWDYPFATGMKTGYTVAARSTIVASANKDGRELIAVVLKSDPRAFYKDAEQLLDYGYQKTRLVPILKMNERFTTLNGYEISYIPKENPYIVVVDGKLPELKMKEHFKTKKKIGFFDQTIVKKGEVIGQLAIYNGEKLIRTVDLVATKDIKNSYPISKSSIYFMFAVFAFSIIGFILVLKRKREKQTINGFGWLEQ
ncbi:D-alanyl-D-alanine carboxypeptidase family protein [Tepidibacillus fermentans]|nr:D-alanyl-D-alanine carboxypeptidase family protein [Tepidibacillus fermentans]